MKAAVYMGTRNVYEDMIPAIKSLLCNSDVDRVYMLIEDDKFGSYLPDCVNVVNVSKQRWFKKSGPNYKSKWTWMVLMRGAYPIMFEKFDTIVGLDNDAIVVGDVSDLFTVDLEDNYIAGVIEPAKSAETPYVNMGVIVYNLKKLREDGTYKSIIWDINNIPHYACEQDAYNSVCAGKIKVLPPKYNINNYTQNAGETKIRHFAAEPDWRGKPLVSKYRRMPWTEVEKRHGEAISKRRSR